ncbi:hypothetical protein HZS_6536 [Henneguya salminicola]|nr:hypothetical protein HZS_6536 [Henneguya salminicola]
MMVNKIFSHSSLKYLSCKILKFIHAFIHGKNPEVHCLATILFMATGFMLGIIFTAKVTPFQYFPPLISDAAVVPLARALLETFNLIAIVCGLVYVSAKYNQMKEFRWRKSLNTIMYMFGLASNLLFPIVFIYDTKNFPIAHNILTFTTMTFYVIYFWFQTFATKYLCSKCYSDIKQQRLLYKVRFLFSLLSTGILMFQIFGIIYKRTSIYNTMTAEQRLLNFKAFVVATSLTEWIIVFLQWLNIELCYFEIRPEKGLNRKVVIKSDIYFTNSCAEVAFINENNKVADSGVVPDI